MRPQNPDHQKLLDEFRKLTQPSPCTLFISRMDDNHVMIRKQDYRFVFNEEQSSRIDAQLEFGNFIYNAGVTHEELGLILDVIRENKR